MSGDNPTPEMVRLSLRWSHTLDQAIEAGWRLRVGCLACDKPKRIVDLKTVPRKYANVILDELPFVCLSCKRHRNKPWIGPAGYDTVISVVYPGEE